MTQRTCTLGVVVPDIDNPFFSGLVRGAENAAYAEDYSVFLCNTNEEPEREIAVLQSLEEKQIDGLLLCSSRLDDMHLKNVISRFPAVVLVSRYLENSDVGMALIDERAGGRMIAEHLFKSGHQSIGLILGPAISFSARERLQGYLDAVDKVGRGHNSDYQRRCSPVVEDGYRTAIEFLKERPEISALICHNDLIAVGVLQACKELDLEVPHDLAVVGYDDVPIASLVSPQLTTCRIPTHDLGERAMCLLLDQIEDGAHMMENILIQPRLIVRASAP